MTVLFVIERRGHPTDRGRTPEYLGHGGWWTLNPHEGVVMTGGVAMAVAWALQNTGDRFYRKRPRTVAVQEWRAGQNE